MPQLQAWRRIREELSGADAANALDQALGELGRLASGESAALAGVVQGLLGELPTPWE